MPMRGKKRKVHRLTSIRRIMSDVPGIWYGLLSLVAIFGVATWCLDKFSSKDNLKKITAICGSISMLALVYVTFTTEGL